MTITRSGVARTAALLLGAALLAACGSGNDGAPGPQGPPGVGVTTAATALNVTVNSVTINSPPVVQFTVTNERNVRFVGLTTSNIRFTLAKLTPGTNGNASAWQAYINRTENPTAGVGTGTTPTTQANSENNGTLVDHGDGTYTYTFANDVTNITTPIAVAYEPTLTHRLGVQVSGGGVPVANATYTWRPSDGATDGIFTRDIVKTASCNQCHGKLALHGGGRVETKYCVTCHNPGTTDANSGNTVDFKVMIHKIHRGENLPSVKAGGDYAIYGFNNTKVDFSDVAFPQDIRNCTKCHNASDADTPQAGNWESAPTREACGSCHDDVNFDTGANHSPANIVAHNGECTLCHAASSSGDPHFVGSVASSHEIPAKIAGAKYRFSIVSVTHTAPGEFPVITYKVTDPTNDDAPYNLLADAVWTATASGASRLGIDLAWPTTDYTNIGNGGATTPASAISLNGLAASAGNNDAPVDNGDGTYTVTSLRAVPSSMTGSGTAALEGHPAGDYDGDGTFSDRVPVKSVVSNFAITDASAVPRRDVVDIAKCDQCHDQLSLHGNNRTDEPKLCVMCHNANNTDIARRPADPLAAVDGKKEESIDFKRLIHGIHGADFREHGLVIYGFGSTANDFSDVGFPGILDNCNTCHKSNSYALPLAPSVLASTIDSGASIPDPSDDTNITPTAAVCSSCHDNPVAQTHMQQNGAAFALSGDPGHYDETCEICHGPGRLADLATVHRVTP